MVIVTRKSLSEDVWNNVYNVLTILEPISTSNVHSSKNSKLILKEGYPQVIIEVPSISFNKETITGNFTNSDIAIKFNVYTLSNESLKKLVDEIKYSLLSCRIIFSGYKMKNMNIDPGVYTPYEEGDKKIHEYEFDVSFRVIAND